MAVSNNRLGLLYRTLQLAAVVVVTMLVWDGRSYIKAEEPDGSVTYWLEAEPHAYEAQVQKDLASNICQNPQEHDYVYGPMWRYENYTCIEIERANRFRKEGSSLMYIPLSFQETHERLRVAPAGTNSSAAEACEGIPDACASGWRWRALRGAAGVRGACACVEEAYYLIVGQEALSLGLEHYYELLKLGDKSVGSRQHSGASCTSKWWWCEDESDQEMLSVFALETPEGLRRVGEPFLSPEPINLALGDLLHYTGLDLNGYNPHTLANMLHCSHPDADPKTCKNDAKQYPLLRMTGLEIQVSLSYYNSPFYPKGLEIGEHRGPVCVIFLRVLPAWSSKPTNDCDSPRQISEANSDCMGRYYYGMSITFSTRGRFGYFDLPKLLLTIGATLSFFTLPGIIVYFLAIYGLGPMSRFYKSTVVERLRADEELCRLVCNTVAAAHSCRGIADKEGQVTHERVLADVNEAFSGIEGMDLTAQAQLTELVCDRLGAEEGIGRSIDLPHFVQSATGARVAQNVRDLFDHARMRWPLERIFAPRTQLRSRTTSFARAKTGGFDEEALKATVEQQQQQRNRPGMMRFNDIDDDAFYTVIQKAVL